MAIDEGFERKLAAILSADVEGYSRLMDDDEEPTVRTLILKGTVICTLFLKEKSKSSQMDSIEILRDRLQST